MTDTPVATETNEAPATPDPYDSLRAALPEDLRAHPSLASYTSFESLVRSHVAAERMIGKRIEDASPEELGRFYARHGRPDSPEAYLFSAPDDGQEPSAPGAFEKTARDWFHDAGLSQRQAEVLYQRWNDYATAQAREADAGSAERLQAVERELRSEWGLAFDRKVSLASRAVAEFGGDDLSQYLDQTGLGNDPRLVRAFARIAEMVGEDSLTGEGERDFAVSPDAARDEIARVLREPAYFDANHPEHDASVARMRSLFAAAYPAMPS